MVSYLINETKVDGSMANKEKPEAGSNHREHEAKLLD